uniref:USP domain-containing protein n=1 Tax=Plectus sambesii TaxID=2011161 RepID=A0A914UNJ9_9BILA
MDAEAEEAPCRKGAKAEEAPCRKGANAEKVPSLKGAYAEGAPNRRGANAKEASSLRGAKEQQSGTAGSEAPTTAFVKESGAGKLSISAIHRSPRQQQWRQLLQQHCFQLFRHLPYFVAALPQAPQTDVRDALWATMCGRHADTTILWQTVQAGFEEERMHDASEFFLHIVDALASLEISELFTFDQMSLVTCLQCPGNPLKNAEQTPQLLHQLHPLTDQHQSFHQLLERAQQAESVDARCNLCGGLQVQHARSKRFEFTINDAQKYLLVYLHKFHRVNGQSVKQDCVITDLNADSQIIFGNQFRTIGAIEHLGTSTMIAHYIAWCRSGDGWCRLNDYNPPEYRAELPTDLENIVTLIFERV